MTIINQLYLEQILSQWQGGKTVKLSIQEKDKGREALLEVIDSDELTFPNAEYSLSNSGDYSIAIYIEGAEGVGIDLQKLRSVRNGLRERICRYELPIVTFEMPTLAIWSIKEAAYKANLNNAGTVISSYQIVSDYEIRYKTQYFKYIHFELPGYYLAVATTVPVSAN